MRLALCLLAALLTCAHRVRARDVAAAPAWVADRPSRPGYLVGIGAAAIGDDVGQARNRALVQALGDLALQVRASVREEVVLHLCEGDGFLSQELDQVTRTRAEATIDGVEIVDTWSGADHCWAYVRLSLERVAARQRQRGLHIDRLLGDLEASDPADAGSLVPGLQALALARRSHAGNPADAARRWRTRTAVAGWLQGIELEARVPDTDLRRGVPLDLDLSLVAVRHRDPGPARPMAGLPLRLAFARGAGAVDSVTWTDASGRARVRLHRIWGSTSRPELVVAVDLGCLARSHGVDSEDVQDLPTPSLRLELTAPPAPARLTCEVAGPGLDSAAPLAAAARQALEDLGYRLDAGPADRALHLSVWGRVRPAPCLHGICFAYLDLGLSARQGPAGDVLFERAVPAIKGAGPTAQSAGHAALDRASDALAAALRTALTHPAGEPATR